MKTIRFLSSAVGRREAFAKGTVREFADEVAARYVAAGIAEWTTPPPAVVRDATKVISAKKQARRKKKTDDKGD